MANTWRQQMVERFRSLGWSQGDWSRASGVPQPMISQFISGERLNITWDTFERLARGVGLKLANGRKPRSPSA